MTAEPIERPYRVIVEHTFSYRVLAESPELAAGVIDQGEYEYADQEECLFSHVDRVVAEDGNFSDADLRGPKACKGGCGKNLPASDEDECTSCFIARLERQRAVRDAATSDRRADQPVSTTHTDNNQEK